ncbi:hypothetical protein [Actinoplanes sp. NPDC051851]|uniref:hypothetical protein n=1 Tax=Actinoplanes sp. NPDC051851 TaxID=3154753 RepID=UPI0034438554
MRRATRGALGAIAVGATVLVAPVLTSSPALAHAACGTTVSDKDSRSWPTGADSARERTGSSSVSSTNCTILGVAYSSNVLDYHCYTVGNDGYTWTYLRNDTTGISGWSRDDLLPSNGSLVWCGF